MNDEQKNRIRLLKDKMLSEPRYASIEQAKIITDCYKKHEGESRVMQRAYALAAALEKIEIRIEPEELIVGNRTAGVRAGVVFPESGSTWVDREFETLPTRPQDTFNVHEEDIRYFREIIKPYWEGKSLEDILKKEHGKEFSEIGKMAKINQTDHAQGHINPNVERWLKKGPQGLKADAQHYLDSMISSGSSCASANASASALTNVSAGTSTDVSVKEFYESIILVMDAVSTFMLRYAELAEKMVTDMSGISDVSGLSEASGLSEVSGLSEISEIQSGKAANASRADSENLLTIAANCRKIAQQPPQTFPEALQSLWFLFVVLQMESNASSFSPGRLDMILEPYFNESRNQGMSDDQMLEWIECLWLKFNQIVYMRNAGSAKYFAGFPIGFNIALGGQDKNGNDFVNDLSFLFLQAQEDLGLPQPNLSCRLHEGTGDKFLKRAIQVVSKGSGMPQFFNDKAVIPALEALGISHEDALNYAIVGCVELTTQGNNLGWSDAAMFNFNKVLELTMTGGIDLLTGKQLGPDFGSLRTYQSFEELEEAFRKMTDYYMDRMVAACAEVEKAHIRLLPTPFLSAVIDDCMEKGLDVTAGGAHYNLSGIQMIQIANLADSMAALKQIVYDEKRVSGEEMLNALKANFEGYEILRARLLNKVPKYGNDVEWVDQLGCKWAEYFRKRLGEYRNYRGGLYHTGMYTVSAHVPMGENVGAGPDGRLALSPLADGGMSPSYGRDLNGPTAVLKSVSRLDKTLTSNGGLLNMKFLPSFFSTQEGIDKFALFLRSFVALEIPHIQFNVVRREDLMAAQVHPDQYRSLTVRVAGYTAYFTELAGKLQDEIIARTSYTDI